MTRKVNKDAPTNETLVKRYFHEVLDEGKIEVIENLFHPRCVMHRPGGIVEGIEGVRGVAERRKETFSHFETQIHDIFGSGDRLVVRLSHHGVGAGVWRCRIGTYDVTGKVVNWDAIAIFRFEDRKIIEEWVSRDELAMMLQFGLLEPAADKH